MHYSVGNGIVIKTENAAKPESQPSKFLLELFSELPPVRSSFDYGCGKLRYLKAMVRTTDTFVIVDSEIQLSRIQMICGKLTNVRNYVRGSNRIQTFNDKEFADVEERFDRAFCINVLSVIPIFAIRKRVLNLIRSKLKPGGVCLLVVQYRNSDFSRMAQMPNSRRWRDGFLIDSLRGYSFYGLISPDNLAMMAVSAGFKIANQILNDGSVYLFCKVPI